MYSRVVPGDPNDLTWLSLKWLPYFTAYQPPNVAYLGSFQENMDRAHLKGNWLYLNSQSSQLPHSSSRLDTSTEQDAFFSLDYFFLLIRGFRLTWPVQSGDFAKKRQKEFPKPYKIKLFIWFIFFIKSKQFVMVDLSIRSSL